MNIESIIKNIEIMQKEIHMKRADLNSQEMKLQRIKHKLYKKVLLNN